MKSHQFAFFNCQFNFFNELNSVRTLTILPTFLSAQATPLDQENTLPFWPTAKFNPKRVG
ncbi:hypothetical protein RISK_002087 [Rhodopirellula islandica]|uniref:Uncharacterized protein n=1 Tax=Rhodopirellula islandica TaxID=595434 RepID=A0A0J1BFY4_RHOIS|nr:hypothetical protein RISK_002087 [Rhodopirellula islandica]